MNKKHKRALKQSLIFIPLIIGSSGLYGADTRSVLDPAQHPESPKYEPLLDGKIIPLDAKLSWIERFNGDETFNANQSLNQTSSTFMTNSTDSMMASSESMSGMKMDGMGTVKGIKANQGKIKVSHGTIDKYGMPAMTMVFKVEDPSQLEGLKKGQQIGFNIDNSSGGFVLTQIMSMSKMEKAENKNSPQKMDARGVIKTIRIEQGKIKIKHGPIDKYGMPGMTMMFKVSDPALLTDLEKGANVDFDIDNSSGGFVITNIAPAAQ